MRHEKFSAAESALGYLYQVRVALILALRRLRSTPDFSVALETLDDVVFESRGTPEVLLQTKHHTNREASLTNSCADLWKTLRIWFDPANRNREGLACFLLTTATAPVGSAASLLRTANRDPEEAQRILEDVARKSTSQDNHLAYEVYLRASKKQRCDVLRNTTVLDGSPSIVSLDSELLSELRWSTPKRQQQQLLLRLEGWWFSRVVRQLSSTIDAGAISGDEIESRMEDLSEQFRRDALPIDDEILLAEEAPIRTALSASVFVRQLELAKVGQFRAHAAIRDFYRASEHRSRWLREQLLFIGELHKYDQKLAEEWQICFGRVTDELPRESCEGCAGRTLVGRTDICAASPSDDRALCNPRFLSHAS